MRGSKGSRRNSTLRMGGLEGRTSTSSHTSSPTTFQSTDCETREDDGGSNARGLPIVNQKEIT